MDVLPLCPKSARGDSVCADCPVGRSTASGQGVSAESRGVGSVGDVASGVVESGRVEPVEVCDEPLVGVRFALASVFVFLVPLALLTAVTAWLTPRVGELRSFAAGLAAAGVALVPPAWLLRRSGRRLGT